MWLCSIIDTKIWIPQSFYMSQNITVLLFSTIKNRNDSSLEDQRKWAIFGPWAIVCRPLLYTTCWLYRDHFLHQLSSASAFLLRHTQRLPGTAPSQSTLRQSSSSGDGVGLICWFFLELGIQGPPLVSRGDIWLIFMWVSPILLHFIFLTFQIIQPKHDTNFPWPLMYTNKGQTKW